jgi:hypothetical protein
MKVAALIRFAVLATAFTPTAGWPQSPPDLELAEARGTIAGSGADAAKVGYSIRVPKGANLHRTGEVQDVYSRPFNSFVIWQVQVEKSPVRTLEAAVKDSTIPGRRSKPEGSAGEGGFQVVLRPTSPEVVDAEVRAYKIAGSDGVRARCSGPAKALTTLIEMCSTLQVLPAGSPTSSPR